MSEIEKLESELDAVIEAGRKAVIGFRKMVADRDAEIASLRAELEASRKDASFQCERAADKDCIIESIRTELAQWTNTANLAGGIVHSLRAEVAAEREKAHYANGVADLAIKHRDVAEAAARQDAEEPTKYMLWAEIRLRDGKIRQDAEEKARLTGLLERWMRHADIGDLWRDAAGHYLGETMVAQDTRAALVRTPTGLPVGVQQEEIARLMEALKPFAASAGRYEKCSDNRQLIHAWNSGETLTVGDLRRSRAALACRPQGEKS